MSRTLVITPTYNERDNLPRIAEQILALPLAVDLLVVDDNSPDGTGHLADELAAAHPTIHVLHREAKNGLGRAYCAGFAWALARDYDFIVHLDSNLSHNPADIPRLVAAAGDADLVLGSRYLDGIRIINWPLRRLILSKCAGVYVRAITGLPFTDPTGGFKCYRRTTLAALDLGRIRSNGYSFLVETTHSIWRRGLRVTEVPIVFTERIHGCSKLSGPVFREAMFMVWRLLLRHGLRRRPRPAPAGR